MISVFCNNKEIPLNKVTFSDGAFTYKLDSLPKDARYIWLTVDPSTPVYMVREEILLVTECIASLADEMYFEKDVELNLSLDYLPYGRCDRVFETGNPNALLSFLNTLDDINGFDKIYINDIHNSKAVHDIIYQYGMNLNIIEKSQLSCFKDSIPFDFNTDYDIVLSPDKGSRKKSRTIAEHLEVDVFNCEKERDVTTGNIIKSVLPDINLKGKKILIPDDLLDGGYTFYKLAELLKKEGALQVDLYVTHMIGSKGLDLFKGLIDNIYCYQIVGNHLNKEDINNFNSREEK